MIAYVKKMKDANTHTHKHQTKSSVSRLFLFSFWSSVLQVINCFKGVLKLGTFIGIGFNMATFPYLFSFPLLPSIVSHGVRYKDRTGVIRAVFWSGKINLLFLQTADTGDLRFSLTGSVMHQDIFFSFMFLLQDLRCVRRIYPVVLSRSLAEKDASSRGSSCSESTSVCCSNSAEINIYIFFFVKRKEKRDTSEASTYHITYQGANPAIYSAWAEVGLQ